MTPSQRVLGSCVVCYTVVPITATTTTAQGTMCPLCQSEQPGRRRLVAYWKKREEVLATELERVRAALALTPRR